MRPEITLIKKGGPNPVMSKRIFLDEHGEGMQRRLAMPDGSGHRNARHG